MEVVVSNSREQIETLVDLISLTIPRALHLTNPQRRMFVELVILHWRGIDTSKKSGIDELRDIMGWSPESRQPYKLRGELRDKNWLKKVRKKWVLPATFQNPPPKEILVEVKISRDE